MGFLRNQSGVVGRWSAAPHFPTHRRSNPQPLWSFMTRQISTIRDVSGKIDPQRDPDRISSRRESAFSSGELPGDLDFGIWNLDVSLPATQGCLKAGSYLPASAGCSKRWKRVVDKQRVWQSLASCDALEFSGVLGFSPECERRWSAGGPAAPRFQGTFHFDSVPIHRFSQNVEAN